MRPPPIPCGNGEQYSISLSATFYTLFRKLKISPFSLKMQWKLTGFSINPLRRFLSGCRDRRRTSAPATRIWNLSDKPVELQVRVGSILKKIYSLKPGGSKRMKFKSICKGCCLDETSQLCVWIHEIGGASLRMDKRQFIGLDDLRCNSEIRIFRDHQRGCLSARKKTRPGFC